MQHPCVFNSRESLELLCNLLKQRVLELGLSVHLHLPGRSQRSSSAYTHPHDRSVCTVDHRPEAKQYPNVRTARHRRRIGHVLILAFWTPSSPRT